MKKTIKLTREQARKMLGKDEAMDALIRANFTDKELNFVKRWKDLGRIEGYYVDDVSDILHLEGRCVKDNRNVFAKKTQAEGVLAMAQLSQLMKDVNGDWTPDWRDSNKLKYTIEFLQGKIDKDYRGHLAQFLAFPTEEIRDKFAEDHRELILEYFKIYQ